MSIVGGRGVDDGGTQGLCEKGGKVKLLYTQQLLMEKGGLSKKAVIANRSSGIGVREEHILFAAALNTKAKLILYEESLVPQTLD